MSIVISSVLLTLLFGCTDPVTPDNIGEKPSDDQTISGSTQDDIVPEKTGDEFSYISVEYRRKSNGKYPYDYETTNSQKTLTVDGMRWMKKSVVNKHDRWGGNPNMKVTNIVSTNPDPLLWDLR